MSLVSPASIVTIFSCSMEVPVTRAKTMQQAEKTTSTNNGLFMRLIEGLLCALKSNIFRVIAERGIPDRPISLSSSVKLVLLLLLSTEMSPSLSPSSQPWCWYNITEGQRIQFLYSLIIYHYEDSRDCFYNNPGHLTQCYFIQRRITAICSHSNNQVTLQSIYIHNRYTMYVSCVEIQSVSAISPSYIYTVCICTDTERQSSVYILYMYIHTTEQQFVRCTNSILKSGLCVFNQKMAHSTQFLRFKLINFMSVKDTLSLFICGSQFAVHGKLTIQRS